VADSISSDVIPTKVFQLKFMSTDASLRFTFTFTRGQQFYVCNVVRFCA